MKGGPDLGGMRLGGLGGRDRALWGKSDALWYCLGRRLTNCQK
jgi:hypothetical protein